jgi:hypothetical protein
LVIDLSSNFSLLSPSVVTLSQCYSSQLSALISLPPIGPGNTIPSYITSDNFKLYIGPTNAGTIYLNQTITHKLNLTAVNIKTNSYASIEVDVTVQNECLN